MVFISVKINALQYSMNGGQGIYLMQQTLFSKLQVTKAFGRIEENHRIGVLLHWNISMGNTLLYLFDLFT